MAELPNDPPAANEELKDGIDAQATATNDDSIAPPAELSIDPFIY